MQTVPIDLITVSREFGAGGSDFASKLGKRLGWAVLDRDLIRQVASRLQLPDSTVERLDEHPPNWLTRVASALLIAPPDSPVGIDTTHLLQMDSVAEAAQSAIVEAAQHPPLIVVGHSGQNIFANRPGSLHIRLIAPLDARVKRLTENFGWDPAAAAKRAQRIDEDRNAYADRYYHKAWRDPLLYDLIFNTDRISIEEAVTVTEQMVR